ncbi:MAG TPA: hypothetical protein DCS29_03130 [Candidatus Magasanikbacteria bacterium]|nr:hypothetical protein [Candidatus Magasanikbacteria bacterium]
MLSLRQRIFAITGVISAILIIIVLFFVLRSRDTDVSTQTSTSTDVLTIEDTVRQNIQVPNNQQVNRAPVDPEENYVKQLARIFVERYGTYSNQNEDIHIADVDDIITSRMRTWIQSSTSTDSRVYEGATTLVLSSHIKQYDTQAGTAIVAIEVQQEVMRQTDALGTISEDTILREADVNLIKVDNTWKVDGLWWQD